MDTPVTGPFLRSGFNYDRNVASVVSGVECLEPSLTQQNQREEADINVIVRRFGVTGELPVGIRPPTFDDFADVFDFQSAQNALIEAERSFMAMPANVRARFQNDPHLFVEFCSDEKNLDEMRKLGLAVPLPDPPAGPAPGPGVT